jgi:hypothetical protein
MNSFHPHDETPWSPMRELGVIAVHGTNPKLTHGAELPTNHPVTALGPCRNHIVLVGRPILAAAWFRAGLFDNPQEPPEMRLQPKLAALQTARVLTVSLVK